MVNNDDDDRERAEKIEAGLGVRDSKARIDFYFATVASARLGRQNHTSAIGPKIFQLFCVGDEKPLINTVGSHAARVLVSAARRNTNSEVAISARDGFSSNKSAQASRSK